MVGIYKMDVEYGRQGDVTGIFLADGEDVQEIIGHELYFGEILGKHSEVVFSLEQGDLKLATNNPIAVDIFRRYKLDSGYNPFNYLPEEEEEEEEEDPDNDKIEASDL